MNPNPSTANTSRPLPHHDSPDIARLFPEQEVAAAARFLLARRADPPTMVEWLEESQRIFGKVNAHAQRRLRQVRTQLQVDIVRRGRDAPVYVVRGWAANPTDDARISPKLQAEVFTVHGRFCAMCGRGPADGVKLQIDHKLPRAWGGRTELENLEPLCTEHNQGKRAFFSTFDSHAPELATVLDLDTPWERIGEALKLFAASGKTLPSELLPIIGRESHAGDPGRRLRDLRVVLGWSIRARKKKVGARTKVEYELLHWEPWPEAGPQAVVAAYERERKRRKGSAGAAP